MLYDIEDPYPKYPLTALYLNMALCVAQDVSLAISYLFGAPEYIVPYRVAKKWEAEKFKESSW